MKIQDWFIDKNYSYVEADSMKCTRPIVISETANAYLLLFETSVGAIRGWFPKSVCRKEAFDD